MKFKIRTISQNGNLNLKFKIKIRTISQNRNLNLSLKFKFRTISQNSIIKFKMNIKNKKIIIKSYMMKFIIILSCFTSYTDFFQSHEAHISDT